MESVVIELAAKCAFESDGWMMGFVVYCFSLDLSRIWFGLRGTSLLGLCVFGRID